MSTFQSQYESFVREHGNLFEEKVVPMDENDLKILRRNDWLYRKIAFPGLLVMSAGAGMGLVYVIINTDLVFIVGLSLSLISCVSLALYVRVAYKSLLENKVKKLVTGIVTEKSKHGSWGYEKYYRLVISDKEKIFGSLSQFKEFKLGDIIHYEVFEYERNQYKKPELLGNIFQFQEAKKS